MIVVIFFKFRYFMIYRPIGKPITQIKTPTDNESVGVLPPMV
ncbi:hypothetical protein [Moraxella lacunata]